MGCIADITIAFVVGVIIGVILCICATIWVDNKGVVK